MREQLHAEPDQSPTDPSSVDVTAGFTYAFDCGLGAGYGTPTSSSSASCPTNDDGSPTAKGKIIDKDGGFSEYTTPVTVQNVPPTANAGGPYTGDEGSMIPLDGTGDDVSSVDKGQLTYAWSIDFTGIDAGGTCKFYDPAVPGSPGYATSSLADPAIKCTDDSKAGEFKLKLLVSDKDGGTSAASYADLKVNGVGPVANTGGPYEGNEGADIQLSGSATDVAANDTEFHWAWQFTAGSGFINDATCGFSDATAQEPTIKCNDNGTVKLTLVATNDNGADSEPAEGTLKVNNVAPVANANGPYSGNEGATIALDGAATDAGANDTHTFAWTVDASGIDLNGKCLFYDPAHPSYAGTETSTLEDPTIKCNDDSGAGTFKVSLTVKDDDLASSAAASEAVLTVLNVAPTVVFRRHRRPSMREAPPRSLPP